MKAPVADAAPEVAHGVLQRIDMVGREVTVRQPGGDASYAVSPRCEVLLNGERVKLRMLQPRDRVRVAHRLRAEGRTALSIEAVTRSNLTLRPFPGSTKPPAPGDDRNEAMTDTPITMTHEDCARLSGLLDRMPSQDRPHFDDLRRELGRAQRVDPRGVPDDVVTMGTTVLLRELETDEPWTFTICYPEDADVRKDRLSVLSPVGTAIIGCRVGDVVRWPVPGGTVRIRIESIENQPEAASAAVPPQEPRQQPDRKPAGCGGL